MSVIRTNAAAAMLGVSPNTLRSWERRFGYPHPRRTEGGHRQFDLAEIEALRQAFEETHNISSAISVARERGQGLASPARLRAALAAFDDAKADRLLEESLAVRSVERTVETLLIAAIEALDEPGDSISPEYGFGWRYATGWLAAIQRVTPPASRDRAVLIFDATWPTDIDALYVQALELFVRRAGMRSLSLPVELEAARVTRALHALEPDAVVLSGGRATLDALGRLVYAARQSAAQVTVFDYRGALPETGASTVERLGPGPSDATATLRERLMAAEITPLRRRDADVG